MTTTSKSPLALLGFLRLALFALTLINMLLPMIATQISPVGDYAGDRTLLDILATYVAPVMAPLFVVVILIDYIMSRVRAADAEGEVSERFRLIARVELVFILLTLIYWVPFFIDLMA